MLLNRVLLSSNSFEIYRRKINSCELFSLKEDWGKDMKLKANCGWEKFRGPALKLLFCVKKRIKKKFNWDLYLLKWIANFKSLFHVIARIVTAILSWVHSLSLEHSFVNSSSNFILYLPYFIFVILLFFPAKSKSKNKRNKLQAPPSNLYGSNLMKDSSYGPLPLNI